MRWLKFITPAPLVAALATSVALNAFLAYRLSQSESSGTRESSFSQTDSGVSQTDRRAAKGPTISPESVIGKPWGQVRHNKNMLHAWETWVSRDPGKALENILHSSEGSSREDMLAAAVGIWAQSDPEAAADWLDEGPALLKSDVIVLELIKEWARMDPAAAARWTGGIADDGVKATSTELLAGIWAQQDGAATVGWLMKSSDADGGGVALHLALEAWAENNPDDLRTRLGLFGDLEVEIEAAKVLGMQMAETDGLGAWQFALGQPIPSARFEAAAVVMETWADLSPSEAARALDALDDHEIRVDGTRALAAKWILADPDLAQDWLAQLPKGSLADAGHQAAVDQLAVTRPREAVEVALRISAPEIRLAALELACSELLGKDPDAAGWLLQQDLPSDLKLRLESLAR